MALLLGIVGKPSSGKSTFLNASCMTNVEVSEIPFTTIEPNKGVSYVRSSCVCGELNVTDNPKNSFCINHTRFIPINLLDVAGLVPDAHKGKGLGNQFLNDLSRADLLIHIVDITGSLDKSGKRVSMGANDPYEDIKFLENEIDLWFKQILEREDWNRFANTYSKNKRNFVVGLADRLSGLKIDYLQIKLALTRTGLDKLNPKEWKEPDILMFASNLRKISKPIIVAANKIDKEIGQQNLKDLENQYDGKVIPCSALAEDLLRGYEEKNIIEYLPGSDHFEIIDQHRLNDHELETLKKIQEIILDQYGGTGVQNILEYAVFHVLNQICVYPVSDPNKYTDNEGNVLPDVFLVKDGTKLKDFVRKKIHTELADNFIYAINAKNKKRLGEDYELKNNDIIKIVASK